MTIQHNAESPQCCSPGENGDGGWGIFNSLFGWQNSATYGSVISYNLYWLVVIVGFLYMGYRERKSSTVAHVEESKSEESESQDDVTGKKAEGHTATVVREIPE
jgi:high-affinity iron transporter